MSNTVLGKVCGSRRGISLIEMAVFISLMSVMMVGGSKVYDVKQSYDRQQVTVNNLNIIKDRLEKFKTANGRLPCVAAPGAKPGSANFGKSISSNCVTTANVDGTRDVTNTSTLKKARIGTIPTRELGLPDAAMIDGWGNRIVYAVSEAYATGTTPDQSEPGAISLVDADSNDNLTSGDNNVIYTVFSPGTDRRGAYNINGEQIESCDASSLAGRNCQGTKAEFVVSSKKNFGGDASKKLTSLFVYGAKTAVAAGLDTSGSTSVQEVVNGCTPVPEADTQACPTSKAGAPAYATTPIGSWVITRTNPCPTGTPPTAWSTALNTCSVTGTSAPTYTSCQTINPGGGAVLVSGQVSTVNSYDGTTETTNVTNDCVWCYASSETQSVSCPSTNGAGTTLIGGNIGQKRDYTCPAQSWGGWYDTSNTCSYCTPTSETQTVACPTVAGQVNTGGSLTQTRQYTCPAQAFGGWADTANTCTYAAACSASSETRTVTDQCGSGYTGSKNQQRDYTCSTSTSGSWGSWYDTADNCSVACTATSETRSKSCGSGMVGSTNEQRDYTCSGGTGTWGSWYSVSGPGAWETFTEAQHTSTTPEANYLFLGGPNPNAGYELGDCTALKREWNTSSISTAYGIIDPQFASTFGTHFDQGALFVDTNNPGKVYQSSHINGVSGGYVPWLQGTNGVDEYTYCKSRRQTTASCVAQCNPTSETRTVTDECPSGYSGSKTQTRNYTCSGGTGTWGPWSTTVDNCVPDGGSCTLHPCTATQQYNTASAIYSLISTDCPFLAMNDQTTGSMSMGSGYTIQTTNSGMNPRAVSCPGPGGQCDEFEVGIEYCEPEASCTPTSETRTVNDQCPSGQSGSKTQQRDYTCSGGTGTWGGWYDTVNNCTASGSCTPKTARCTIWGYANTNSCNPSSWMYDSVFFENGSFVGNGQKCPGYQNGNAGPVTPGGGFAGIPNPATSPQGSNTGIYNGGTFGGKTVTYSGLMNKTNLGGTCGNGTNPYYNEEWYFDVSWCEPCTATSETQVTACPSGQTGTKNLKRDYACPAGTWGNWYEVSNNCVGTPPTRGPGGCVYQPDNSCVIPPECTWSMETRTMACPGGQAGPAITQQRTYGCDQYGTPSWTAWSDMDNRCIPVDGGGCPIAGTACQVSFYSYDFFGSNWYGMYSSSCPFDIDTAALGFPGQAMTPAQAGLIKNTSGGTYEIKRSSPPPGFSNGLRYDGTGGACAGQPDCHTWSLAVGKPGCG